MNNKAMTPEMEREQRAAQKIRDAEIQAAEDQTVAANNRVSAKIATAAANGQKAEVIYLSEYKNSFFYDYELSQTIVAPVIITPQEIIKEKTPGLNQSKIYLDQTIAQFEAAKLKNEFSRAEAIWRGVGIKEGDYKFRLSEVETLTKNEAEILTSQIEELELFVQQVREKLLLKIDKKRDELLARLKEIKKAVK